MAELDLTQPHLDVYDTRSGLWNPEHGHIAIPDGWDFLPSGDAFLTRQVSAAGTYWVAWKPRGRGRGHRRRIGLWAPTAAIDAARAAAEQTEAVRAVNRRAGVRQRERREDRDRSELRGAIITYLDFADEHARLAGQIAAAAAARASEVGSGRVGRTSTLTLAEKAELAARAHIRHHHTDYEDELASAHLEAYGPLADDERYLDVRANAHAAVEEFLAAHRKRH
ncbi:MAG: DUF2293 domain-containing protein [Dermatophilaceae bacterium]